MKNTNTKSVKGKVKKSNKKVTAKVEAAPVADKVATIQVEVTPAPVVNQIKRGRGRPPGVGSQSIVNLQNLIDSLPANSTVLLPNPFIRSLANLGINLKATPYKANLANLSQITEKLRKVSSAIQVQDLNTPEPAVV